MQTFKRRLLWLLKGSILAFGFIIFFTHIFLRKSHPSIIPQKTIFMDTFLYFNRIPKTGSENFAFLIHQLANIHNFTHQRYGQPDPRHLTEEQQRNHIKKFVKMNNHQQQLAYDRHVHFIDFRNFIGNSTENYQPIWFSVIRDPIEKFVSRYNYNRNGKAIVYDKLVAKNDSTVFGLSKEEWKSKDIVDCIFDDSDEECNLIPNTVADLSIPYFCGQNDECSLVQSKWALEKAKSNIEEFYPVVAVLEDLDNTFFVLENTLPKFFRGISKLYYETLKKPRKNKGKARKPLPVDAFQIIKSKLSLEYELYEFLKARLKLQSRKLKQWRLYKYNKPVIKMDEIRKLKYKSK